MQLPKYYEFKTGEERWRKFWEERRIYGFERSQGLPIYSIDTPPPTVSGDLHIGHLFSYTHADVIARFWRMNGKTVFYPFGFDDNGLPTERFVEQHHGVRRSGMDREEFAKLCLRTAHEMEGRFEQLFKRLGLSVDWGLCYRTISPLAQKISQRSFIDLFWKGRIYRRDAPSLWCPECHTAIAQAEVEDNKREVSTFVDIQFEVEGGERIVIATTRPELLPACVAVFVHPEDDRYKSLIGKRAKVPLAGEPVPIIADEKADPEKGTGIVMCCTFGDTTDIAWWNAHNLPLKLIIGRDGRMNGLAGKYAGLTLKEARSKIIKELTNRGLLRGKRMIRHTVNVHERCGTEIEFIVTKQWFIRILDIKEKLIAAGRAIDWYPPFMRKRYEHWVQNLRWDWCISRQRPFGIPFPVWFCKSCGEILLASEEQLPVDPNQIKPGERCRCGSSEFEPERDVMDTWATSSLTPQINAHWGEDLILLPMDLRPQAHDIIRSWTFYTLVKSILHQGEIPWRAIMISGHTLLEGRKLSKSKGAVQTDPLLAIEEDSADAIRYWACESRPGRDSFYSEKVIAEGKRLTTKLWNAAKFTISNLEDYDGSESKLQTIDLWLLTKLSRTVEEVTARFKEYEYSLAKEAAERFFWRDLCNNYIEIVKGRLYGTCDEKRRAAQYTLYQAVLTVLKLFAPIMPYVTEEIYQLYFAKQEGAESIHISPWPLTSVGWSDVTAEEIGDMAILIIEAVRKEKSLRNLPLGAPVEKIEITCAIEVQAKLHEILQDIADVARARRIKCTEASAEGFRTISPDISLSLQFGDFDRAGA